MKSLYNLLGFWLFSYSFCSFNLYTTTIGSILTFEYAILTSSSTNLLCGSAFSGCICDLLLLLE
jgi:hypothetical protein